MTKLKKFIKTKVFPGVCVSLLFLFLVVINIPVTTYSALAETPEQTSEQTTDNSNYISDSLYSFLRQGVASGDLQTFDYFSFDENKVYDEFVVLYDYSFNPVANTDYYLLNFQPYYYYYNYNTGNYGYSLNANLNIISTTSSTPSSQRTVIQADAFTNTGLNEYWSDYSYKFYRYPSYSVDVPNLNDGYFNGITLKIDGNFRFAYENIATADSYIGTSTARCYSSSDSSGVLLYSLLGYSSYSQITFDDVFSLIDFNFVSLADLVNYAYSKGYTENAYDIYGSLTGATCDVEFVFTSYDDNSEVEITLYDLPCTFKNGFLSFDNLSIYELVHIIDDEIIPITNDEYLPDVPIYYWSGGQVYINLLYPLYYDKPYYRFIGGDVWNCAFYITTNYSFQGWVGSELVNGLFEVPQPATGFVQRINLPGGRGWDNVGSYRIQDTSIKSTFDYNKGYQNGFDVGFSEGNQIGFNQGSEYGYASGYIDGSNSQTAFLSFFSAVIDVPVSTFVNLFDINILGVNMKQFFLSLLGACLVLALVKFFLSLGGSS